MKRRLISPLVSGLVLPGTGQVLNRQPVKGIALIASTTVLFLLILLKVLVDLNRAFQTMPDLRPDPQIIRELASAMGSARSYLSDGARNHVALCLDFLNRRRIHTR